MDAGLVDVGGAAAQQGGRGGNVQQAFSRHEPAHHRHESAVRRHALADRFVNRQVGALALLIAVASEAAGFARAERGASRAARRTLQGEGGRVGRQHLHQSRGVAGLLDRHGRRQVGGQGAALLLLLPSVSGDAPRPAVAPPIRGLLRPGAARSRRRRRLGLLPPVRERGPR